MHYQSQNKQTDKQKTTHLSSIYRQTGRQT